MASILTTFSIERKGGIQAGEEEWPPQTEMSSSLLS
jgi:hypothetical protein